MKYPKEALSPNKVYFILSFTFSVCLLYQAKLEEQKRQCEVCVAFTELVSLCVQYWCVGGFEKESMPDINGMGAGSRCGRHKACMGPSESL